MTPLFSSNVIVSDIVAGAFTVAITVSLLKLLERTATTGVFDQKVNRKLVHMSFGLVFMLCWPMFSCGGVGAMVASFIPGMNVVNMLLLGSGIWKNDATVKSMTRNGNYRELLKGPLWYVCALTVATALYWKTSLPTAIALHSNLCAGDGVADITGRRLGRHKLPYNRDKSFAGTIAMATASFLTSLGYMVYFGWFGYVEEGYWCRREVVLGFLIISIGAAFVESHPISTHLDDNFTVPLAVIFLATFLF